MKFFFAVFLITALSHTIHAQERYLLIRSGGGVTGMATEYKIDPSGNVLKRKGVGDIGYDEGAKLKKCTTRRYFKKTKSLLTETTAFDHPGNMYTSISLYEEGKETKMTWGDATHDTPENAKKLYQKMNDKLSKLTFSSNLRK